MDFGKYDCKAILEDSMLKGKVHNPQTTYISHIYIWSPLIVKQYYQQG